MKRPEIEKLVKLMERLRAPDGCPWDKEQTLESIVPFIIEEAYEVVAAIDSKDPVEIKEELGDLLFQIIFCTRITEEKGAFCLADVINASHEKMVRRHPHVFGESKANTSEEVLKRWAEIKKDEKKEKNNHKHGYLEGIPKALPALLRAHKVSQKAARAGFDWKSVKEVMEKLNEEVDEFHSAVNKKDAAGMEEELGDMLFTMVNVGRFLEVNPEDALRKTVGKFIRRFHHIEKSLNEKGEQLTSATIEEMERLWQEAKTHDIRS